MQIMADSASNPECRILLDKYRTKFGLAAIKF